MADLADRALARRMALGDLGALEDLYDRYASFIYSFALRMVGESAASALIVEDTFTSAWHQADAIVGQPGTVRDWLVSHAHTTGIALVHQRRAGKGTEAARKADPAPEVGPEDQEDRELAEQRTRTQEAWSSLSREQKLILELAYFQGYTQDEIAPLALLPLSEVTQALVGALETLGTAAAMPLGGRPL
ncbi:MAG TPA: sigma-70 family RNA polymerase sigma factor [Chloroflexota bacterium]|nr:sigma-70 family RNA polymerase sigma factor [Chloroflexota bacterium]